MKDNKLEDLGPLCGGFRIRAEKYEVTYNSRRGIRIDAEGDVQIRQVSEEGADIIAQGPIVQIRQELRGGEFEVSYPNSLNKSIF